MIDLSEYPIDCPYHEAIVLRAVGSRYHDFAFENE
jgi:hypothetical protein